MAAARRLHRLAQSPGTWVVRHGSVLDAAFLGSLGTFDLVYASASREHGVLQPTASTSILASNLQWMQYAISSVLGVDVSI